MTSARRWLVAAGTIFVLAGLGVLIFNFWPDISFRLGLIEERYPYRTRLLSPAEGVAPGGTTTDDGAPTGGALAPTGMPAARRLVVPRIGVDVAVYGGADADDALERGVYAYPDSPDPGGPGNLVIAGHRQRERFALLHVLERGDVIMLYWDGVEHDYLVERSFEVLPHETGILESTAAETLTLYTCVPRFLGNRRTVVIARPLE